MIEDELRSVLTDRAGGLPDNPARVREVRSRIGARRRAAGTALTLVLLAVAGLVLTRLPGRPETLPAGAPPGPYFGTDATVGPVPGYVGGSHFSFRGDAAWSAGTPLPGLRRVVVTRCRSRGDLTLRNRSGRGPELTVRCRVRVGDHYEGGLPIDPGQADELFAESPTGGNVEVRPSSPGAWAVALLDQRYPERLTAADLRGAPLDGLTSPAGGRIAVTVPGDDEFLPGLPVAVRCVRDVRLALTVAGRPLVEVTCDDTQDSTLGFISLVVPDAVLRGLGIRPGRRIEIDVRPTGRATDQWAVVSVG